MGLFSFFFGTPKQITPSTTGEYDNLRPVRSARFDGEKTPYELGDVLNVLPDYQSLRLRAYEASLKSDVVKIISNKFFKWIIGTGLKLQAEPNMKVLASEKIKVSDLTDFKTIGEARFNLWAKSKRSDFYERDNLHVQANNALKASFFGGDCLVVVRFDGEITVQVIDGQQVQTPYFDDKHQKAAEKLGNTIRNGIEKDKNGKHVAFYVRVEKGGNILGDFERVPAYGKSTNRRMAWMLYFDKHRIDNDRGIGALPAVLEKIDKLDRFTEATVGSAEERAKLPYFFEHGRNSDGENPLARKIQQTMRGQMGGNTDDSYSQAETKATTVAQTMGKQVFNLPPDVKVTMPTAGTVEKEYPEFWKAVFNSIAAAVDIPPEVALQMYNSNYSASRAAINAWQHLINVFRTKFTDEFYKPIYDLWLEVEVLKSKINAPGYLKAVRTDNWFALEAYSNCRFTGSNMPHIDPKKEVDAIRGMLGSDMAHVPLTSLEQATEKLNAGEWSENYKKFLEEQKQLVPKKDGTNQS